MNEITDELRAAYGRRPRVQRWQLQGASEELLEFLAHVFDEATLRLMVFCESPATGTQYLIPADRWGGKTPKFNLNVDSTWWDCKPQPGTTWQHYKGGRYRVVQNAHHVLTGRHFVIYRSETDGTRWARDAESWFSLVNNGQDRKTYRFNPANK